MKFKKGSFYIQMIPAAKVKFELRSGWLSDDYQFSFHKSQKNMWTVSDLRSGMEIYCAATRKECAEWIERNYEKICLAREEEKYQVACRALEDFTGRLA